MEDKMKELKKIGEEFQKKMDSFEKYTHEELNRFEELGVEGEVCRCQMAMANTMTVECVLCGKIQARYAKAYARRQK